MNIIVKNCINEKGNYFTLINTKNNSHCHTMKSKDIKEIVRMANCIEKGMPIKGARHLRIKAARLFYGKGIVL